MAFEQDGIKQVDKEELKELLKSEVEKPIIIDVRELEEYEEAHIPGLPLIPMGTIPTVIDQLDKDQSYLFVCRSGGRSQNVAMYLKNQGFKDVTNYNGGMLAWDGEVKTGAEWVVKEVKELNL
ncbi:rhodanese-like domain-containing protein [Halalkalibacter alkalisediminis]|uniref:Rhodanese-like domain-containing protein n=1 Tax=Halalkalibacter alkalisediminis TaxID=935616 RepID=A0ABV6NAT2_9BACI|nr:rhodanese-like domain-containing protein [Halalkalibacter alkalisediminis]